ncbi:MAG: CaiB/BaiF CoA transferase family protein [Beijerinckiaceae bacterium]
MTFAPLKGIRILDLTSVVVGPVATWRLGQYGAEIVKLESPEGDLMRGLGGLSPTGQHSGTYLHLNRGKRNICLDLKKPSARKVVEKLVASADVIVANMRPQALERLGLDSETIRGKYPDKIYCLITGYGTDGPYAGQPTYDSVVQGATGMAGLMLARDGAPAYVPMLICDHVVGEITAGAVLAAVLQHKIHGAGTSIEIPMFETMATFVLQEHLAQQSFTPPVGPFGDLRLLSPHNKPVKTSDGWISFTVNTDPQVQAFLRATGRDALINDTRFSSVAGRAKHVGAWFEIRGAALTSKTTAEWLAIFQAADIAAMPCHTLETLRADPHLAAVGFFQNEQHPTEGQTIAMRSSIKCDGAFLPSGAPAQPKGWETRMIMRDLGISEADGNTIIAEGAARDAVK